MFPSRLLAIALLCPMLALTGTTRAESATHRPVVSAAETPAAIRVAAANLQEGILLRYRADRRDATDRRVFARRLLSRPGRPPDVVLLQEALGTARRVARALNSSSAANGSVSYTVATGTGLRFVRGTCDGERAGRFTLLRGSSILVNSRTVTEVHQRGTIRTWGRWLPRTRQITGRRGYGCTAHPWISATVRTPGGPRAALLLDTHLAPAAPRLKSRALTVLRRELELLAERTPGAITVLGGDLNLNRCRQDPQMAETLRCTLRVAHHGLIRAGYEDTVRSLHPTGPDGVVGVARRIDFIYTDGTVVDAWYDRCYRAYFVSRWRCGERRSVFARPRLLRRCQERSLRHGRPGDGCPPAAFRRYYSDHPILVATIS